MNRFFILLILFSIFISFIGPARSQTTESTINGQSVDVSKEDKDTQHVVRAFDLFSGGNFIRETLGDFFDFISSSCYYALIRVYSLVGTILIPIPDLTRPESFIGDAGGVIRDVYSIMVYLGFFLAIVGFVAYVGPMASGLSNGGLTVMAFLRLAIALALIFAWPHIFSLLSNMATEIGYLIFGQNRIATSEVFAGIKNLQNRALDQANQGGSFASPSGAAGNVHLYARSIWSVVYTLSLFLSLIGIFVAGRKISTGEQGSFKLLYGALTGLVLIIAAGGFAKYLIPSLSMMEGSNFVTSAANTLNTGGSPNLPDIKSFPSTPALPEMVDTYAKFVGSLLRIIVSLWGLVICVEVLLAKFFQVASLVVLFLLGPVLAGLVSNPKTESIARNGLNLTLNLILNSIIWAIALLGLYLVTHITYGVETLGTANILTSMAILAGLQLIRNSDKFASLFAPGGGGHMNHMGGAWAAAIGTTMAAGRIMSDTKKVISEKGKSGGFAGTAGSVAGAAVGALVPGIGPSRGGRWGAAFSQTGASALSSLSNTSGGQAMSSGFNNVLQKFGMGRSSNPYDAPGSRSATKTQGFSKGRKGKA